jgi:hypothetical protein
MTLPVGAGKGGALHAFVTGGEAKALLIDAASKLVTSNSFRNLNIGTSKDEGGLYSWNRHHK